MQFPVYVISKGRHESRLTVKALQKIGIRFRVVIEPQEQDAYAAVIPLENILVLPFSNLGQGSIPARNWVWQHSIDEGHGRHWILDDNIRRFYRLHKNKKYVMQGDAGFTAIEDFAERYENLHMAGMQYELLAPAKNGMTPVVFNTRVYSCILLTNKIHHRWRGRYNEDTDLSLRILKNGACTALVNAFLCDKQCTMTMKGGNTESLYKLGDEVDGRLLMAQSLQKQHPDVVTIKRRWNRWQHVVDYRPFKKNKLKRKPGLEIQAGSNEYGMRLIQKPSVSGNTLNGS